VRQPEHAERVRAADRRAHRGCAVALKLDLGADADQRRARRRGAGMDKRREKKSSRVREKGRRRDSKSMNGPDPSWSGSLEKPDHSKPP
jgi:hypothetical protein